MIQKIIVSLILAALLFIGVILAQNANPNNQSNSNISNTSFNSNQGMSNKPWKPKYEPPPKPESKYCKSLSASDAKKIVGYQVEFRQEKDEQDGQISCRYEKGSKGDGLLAEFQTFADSRKAKRVLTLERESLELTNIYLSDSKLSYKTQIIQGVGDNAWIERIGDSIILWVQKGQTVFSIDATESGKFSLVQLKLVANKLARQFAALTPSKSILSEMIQENSTNPPQTINMPDSDKLNFPFNIPENNRNSPTGQRSVACQYLTEVDAKSLTNPSVIFYASTTYKNEIECIYTQRNDFFPSVKIKATTYQTTKQAKAAQMSMVKTSELVNLRLAQDDSRIEPLTVIGVVASLVTNDKNGATIYCQKKSTMFEIEVLDLKDKTIPIGVLKSIAKKVAENFKK
jgi:hypothetical protein